MPRRRKNQFHFLYKTICKEDGKFYVGMHSTNNLNDGYLGSGIQLKRSIKKYGGNNHLLEILEFFESREDLKNAEKEMVNLNLLQDPSCMNLNTGGAGDWHIANKNKDLQREKWNKALEKLKYLHENDSEWKKRVSKNISLGQKKSYQEGRIIIIPDWTGKKHSVISKKIIGEKNSISQSGHKNSQYGTCWITNGTENKKIHKGDLIPNGWKLGRKMKITP